MGLSEYYIQYNMGTPDKYNYHQINIKLVIWQAVVNKLEFRTPFPLERIVRKVMPFYSMKNRFCIHSGILAFSVKSIMVKFLA